MNPDPRLESLARLLVGYSLDVRPGDVMLIAGHPASDPLITLLFREALQVGALPVVRLTPGESLDTEIDLLGGGSNYLNPLGLKHGRAVDCSVGISVKMPADPAAAVDPPADRAEGAAARLRTFLEKAAKGELRWVNVLYPTDSA